MIDTRTAELQRYDELKLSRVGAGSIVRNSRDQNTIVQNICGNKNEVNCYHSHKRENTNLDDSVLWEL